MIISNKYRKIDFRKIQKLSDPSSKFPLPREIIHVIGFDTEHDGQRTLSFQFYHYASKRALIYVRKGTTTVSLPNQYVEYVQVPDFDEDFTFTRILLDVYKHFGVEFWTVTAIGTHSGANDFLRFKEPFRPDFWHGNIFFLQKKIVGNFAQISHKAYESANHKYILDMKNRDPYTTYIVDTAFFYQTNLFEASRGTKSGQKVQLDPAERSDMARFIKENPLKFFEYAVHDARITAELTHEIFRAMFLMQTVFNVDAFAHSPQELMGNLFSVEKLPDDPAIDLKGAHRKALSYGVISTHVYDYNIISCQNTIIACMPVWETKPIEILELDELYNYIMRDNLCVGEIELEFRFKPQVPVTFPFKVRSGLVYTLGGTTVVSPQEFFVAYVYLDFCKIKRSKIYPSTNERTERAKIMSGLTTIHSVVKAINPPLERVLRTIANSAYGIHKKDKESVTTFLPDSAGNMQPLMEYDPPSLSSNNLVSTFINSMTRAVVAEYLYYIHSKGMRTYSVNGDGFMTDLELDSDAMRGVGVYGSLLSKVRTDMINMYAKTVQPLEILEFEKHYRLYIFHSRRHGFETKNSVYFTGARNTKLSTVKQAVKGALDEGKPILLRVKRMSDPAKVYDSEKIGQTLSLYSDQDVEFNLNPTPAKNYWEFSPNPDADAVIPYTAIAFPFESTELASKIDNYRRTREGEKLESMAMSSSLARANARVNIYKYCLTTIDLAKVLYRFYPGVQKNTLTRFFLIGKNSIANTDLEPHQMPQSRDEFVNNICLVLDCFIHNLEFGTSSYEMKVNELRSILIKLRFSQ